MARDCQQQSYKKVTREKHVLKIKKRYSMKRIYELDSNVADSINLKIF